MRDAQDIERLLNIFEKAHAHGSALVNIRDAAMEALKKADVAHALPKPLPPAPVEVPDAEPEATPEPEPENLTMAERARRAIEGDKSNG